MNVIYRNLNAVLSCTYRWAQKKPRAIGRETIREKYCPPREQEGIVQPIPGLAIQVSVVFSIDYKTYVVLSPVGLVSRLLISSTYAAVFDPPRGSQT